MRSYVKIKDDDESAGSIINAIIALVMEIPWIIFFYTAPYDYLIFGCIFVWFWLVATIGDKLRKFSSPGSFSTKDSAFGIFDTQLYWKIGPQVKGVLYSYIVVIIAFFYFVTIPNLAEKITPSKQHLEYLGTKISFITRKSDTNARSNADINTDSTSTMSTENKTPTTSSKATEIQYRD